MKRFLESKDGDFSRRNTHNAVDLQREHTQLLYDFLKPHYEHIVEPCLKLLDEPTPRITFETLWYIFPPGTDVYCPVGSSHCVFVIHKVVLEDGTDNNPSVKFTEKTHNHDKPSWKFQLWCLDTSGQVMGRKLDMRMGFQWFDGFQDVTKLQICPVKYWDRFDGALREGHLLADYSGPCNMGATTYYSGKIVVDHRRGLNETSTMQGPTFNESFDPCPWIYSSYDNMLIYKAPEDTELGITIAGENDSIVPRNGSDRSDAPIEDHVRDISAEQAECQELNEHQLLLIYPRVCAFALKTKEWLSIWSDYISEVIQSSESLDNLVLDKSSMQTIRALATRQNSKRRAWAADFIEGKGAGQIMLLHGPPGVGKTYTVEAIAQFLHKPLLALTVADIGTQETKVESELFKWFSLAEAWNAVLLVDEADIFLERRQNRDLARNGLVSAFLRRMEYFKGLLFLTTNRVGQIDDAFISRVHAAIGYRPLTSQDRMKIWQGFFHKLEKERAGKLQIARGAKKWVLGKAESGGAQLNGRDIRNALQTAITLAEAEYEEDPAFDPEKTTIVVEQSHFERVLEISEKFHTYLKSIKKEDERKRAAMRYDRNDFHDEFVGDSTAYPDD
ncbi:P-loop containing nucleoside triphosphate hydrolase protein [Xylariaceae sp. FL0255]|nr:P-loop containing nucleoside triphosphate hydrolase protein [Xylariaceae sp. FL0255]